MKESLILDKRVQSGFREVVGGIPWANGKSIPGFMSDALASSPTIRFKFTPLNLSFC